MVDTTTLNETLKAIDGTEEVRLATTGANWRAPLSDIFNTIGGGVRTVVDVDTTYYVATTGNDSTGDGTIGNPWATIQHAIEYIEYHVIISDCNITIQVADGTYDENLVLPNYVGTVLLPNDGVSIIGNTTTPNNCKIMPTTEGNFASVVANVGEREWSIDGFRIDAINSATDCSLFALFSGSSINIGGNIIFGATGPGAAPVQYWVTSYGSGSFAVISGGSSDGKSAGMYQGNIASSCVFFNALTFTSDPAWTVAGIVTIGSDVNFETSFNFSGSVTGQRFLFSEGGTIDTPIQLPGSTDGSIDSHGEYNGTKGTISLTTDPTTSDLIPQSWDLYRNTVRETVGFYENESGTVLPVTSPKAFANLNMYVDSSTGSDSNDGSIGTPFATIQHAVNVVSLYDWQNLYFPTINVADGTYPEEIFLGALINIATGGIVTGGLGQIIGNTTTEDNCIVSHPVSQVSGVQFTADGPSARWFVTGFKLEEIGNDGASYLSTGLFGGGFSLLIFDKIHFDFTNTLPYSSAIESAGSIVQQSFPFTRTSYSGDGINTFGRLFYAVGTNSYIGVGNGGDTIFINAITGQHLAYCYGTGVIDFDGVTFVNPENLTCTIFSASVGAYSALVTDASWPGTPWQFGIEVVQGGNAIINEFVNTVFGLDQSRVDTPTTGATVTMFPGQTSEILNPSGTLAALTVNLPSNPVGSQAAGISTTQIITALTVATTDGSSVVGAQSTLIAGQAFKMIYDFVTNSWYPSA